MAELYFLKLGGSLLTDKTRVESVRQEVIDGLADEIALARAGRPELGLVIGHGSGSFGHVAAAKHGTRHGVWKAADWWGYSEVSDAAARLNGLVRAALLTAGVPVVTLQPSASTVCQDGRIASMAVEPVQAALAAGLVPLVYGDVAIDRVRGGTIISTEEILSFLAHRLRPDWLLLAGETDGVLDQYGAPIPLIGRQNLEQFRTVMGGSRGTDVTGGMLSKVEAMLALCDPLPALSVRIFNGLESGLLQSILMNPDQAVGTRLGSG
jgi:isopentenyl phosphate kinase